MAQAPVWVLFGVCSFPVAVRLGARVIEGHEFYNYREYSGAFAGLGKRRMAELSINAFPFGKTQAGGRYVAMSQVLSCADGYRTGALPP